MKYCKTSIFQNLTVPKHLAPDETPQYLSKTTKLAYAPRKHEKSLIKFKKIWKKYYNTSSFRVGVLLHAHKPTCAKVVTSVIIAHASRTFVCFNHLKMHSRSEKIFGYWKPFKNDEKCFLFQLKSSFHSQDI